MDDLLDVLKLTLRWCPREGCPGKLSRSLTDRCGTCDMDGAFEVTREDAVNLTRWLVQDRERYDREVKWLYEDGLRKLEGLSGKGDAKAASEVVRGMRKACGRDWPRHGWRYGTGENAVVDWMPTIRRTG